MSIEEMTKIGIENGRDNSDVLEMKPVSGGSINESYYVRTKEGEYDLKHHTNSEKVFGKSEAIRSRLIKENESDKSDILEMKPVSGSSINELFYVRTKGCE